MVDMRNTDFFANTDFNHVINVELALQITWLVIKQSSLLILYSVEAGRASTFQGYSFTLKEYYNPSHLLAVH